MADVREPEIVYASTNHGLYKSSDGGMTWLPALVLNSISNFKFAQSAKDPNVMYAAVSQDRSGQVYRSIDSGKSWSSVSPSDLNKPISVLAIDPMDSNQVYVKDDAGFDKTLNGGRSWGDITPRLGGGRVDFISFDPVKNGHIFAGGGFGGGFTSDLLESEDGGLSWAVKNYPAPPSKWKMAFAAPGISTWDSFAINPSNPKYLMGISGAVGNHVDHLPGLVISEDGGQTWAEISLRKKHERSTRPSPDHLYRVVYEVRQRDLYGNA